MTVKIVTDSVSDIPPETASELGITIVPLSVHFGTKSYRDRIDLTPEKFYHKLTQSKTLPTTAAPPPLSFADAYDKLAEETDDILVITLGLGATHENAVRGIELMNRTCKVEVVDSRQVLMAQGLVVIATAKAANAGASFDEALDIAHRSISRVDFRAAFDTLEYLQRGGRIGKAQAFLGSMLKINPIICIKDGEVFPAGRERSRAKAIDHLYNFAMSYSHIEEMAIEAATTPDEAEILANRLSSKFPKERIYWSKMSPVIVTHTGPRAIAVSVLGDRQQPLG
jgi:DegV family protein with EDD domain